VLQKKAIIHYFKEIYTVYFADVLTVFELQFISGKLKSPITNILSPLTSSIKSQSFSILSVPTIAELVDL